MRYGNAIPQIEWIDGMVECGRYRNVLEANARQSLRKLGQEGYMHKVKYFFNHKQGDTWTCGWTYEI